jgi:protein TonB
LFTVSLHRRAEKVTFAPVPSAGNIAIVVSLVAHLGFGAALVHRARSAYRVDTQALLARPSAELAPLDVDDVQLVDPAEQAPEPETRVASAVAAPPSAAHAVAHEARAVAPHADAAIASVAPVASVARVAEPSVPRFTMLAPVVGVSAPVSARSAALGAEQGVSAAPSASVGPFSESAVDAPAKLLRGAPPHYTAAAESAAVEAEVPLEVVIDTAGSVQNARALTHVGYGLDEAALSAVRSYRFSPARRGGELVAVRMRWVMRFQLR